MKELSIEEEAKRYNEALDRAKAAHKDEDRHLKATLERIFPQLKEKDSENERIRKEIIDFVYDKTDTYELREKSNSWLAWLEKQCERKSWSEEDESMFECIKWSLVDLEVKEQSMGKFGQEIAWLKSLKDRIQLFDIEYGLGIDH